MEGHWDNGLLSGTATISYVNGDYKSAEVNFKDGLLDGKAKVIKNDGSYEICTFSEGVPSSYVITMYDKKDRKSGYDYLYNGNNLSTLIDSSKSVKYNKLFNADVWDTPIMIEGMVIKTYETKNNAYILLEDADSHFYILTYQNTVANMYSQAIVPNLQQGDMITAYGYYYKVYRFEDFDTIGTSGLVQDAYENQRESISVEAKNVIQSFESTNFTDERLSFPTIQIFYANLNSDKGDLRRNVTYNYGDIVRYPYIYFDLKRNITGTVIKVKIVNNHSMLLLVKNKNAGDEYYVDYEFNSDDPIPASGDTITFTGSFIGNEKVFYKKSFKSLKGMYTIYPKVSADEITIK